MRFVFFVLIILLANCNLRTDKSVPEICVVAKPYPVFKNVSFDKNSIFSLHGNFIKIKGVFRYDFEDVALYPSAKAPFVSALWLDLKLMSEYSNKITEIAKDKDVYVIGKVDTLKKGHLNGYLATLDSVFCITASR
jgi:hypothetical protein